MGVLSDDDEFAVNVRKPRPSHPKGWEPGFEWDGRKGVITSDPVKGGPPQFESLLAELCAAIGEDPADYEIVGDIQVRRWQQTPGDDYLYYHRATISRRVSYSDETDLDVEALVSELRKRKPRKTATGPPKGTGAGNGKEPRNESSIAGLFVGLSDWQVGKGDGDGVEGTVARLAALPDLIHERWRQLRKVGVPLDVVYLCFLGDLRESCHNHYAQQEFRTQLNHRDQRKIIRAAADRIIDRAAGFAPRVAVKVVGGNHGEERQDGKSRTDFADNVDVAVIEDVAYAYSKSDRYENVSFAIPNDDLTLTFEHEGVVVGLAHSHQAGFGSGDPRAKIHNWWKGQMDGQQPIGDADVLVTAHWHHPWVVQRGARTQIGCGALDGGSDWFRSSSGMDAPPSTTSFVLDSEGWSHYQLLR